MENEDGYKKGIVLNRMYAGKYLSENLGHEAINMFQADDGKHYLYLNARGNITKDKQNVEHMLLVRYRGERILEVVALAKGLIPVESACCSLSRKLDNIDKDIQEKQLQLIKPIKYDNVSMFDLFNDAEQQNVYVSYFVGSEDFFKPIKPIFIAFVEPEKTVKTEILEDKDEDVIIALIKKHKFSSQSLRQFIMEGDDWQELQTIIDNPDNWMIYNEKVRVPNNFTPYIPSLFDICEINNLELPFSCALKYYIEKYPQLWRDFFESKINEKYKSKKRFLLGKLNTVEKEVDAKVEIDKWMKIFPHDINNTGGRVDLLIDANNAYIIIENKISSGINKKKDEIDNKTQLDRYKNYIDYLIEEEKVEMELTRAQREKFAFVLAPDYNMPKDIRKYEELRYSDICSYLRQNEAAWKCVKNDADFYAFYKAMKRHSYSSESESLYEDMKKTFYTRIHQLQMKMVND